MNEAELDEIVTAWLTAEQAKSGSPEHERNWWAVSAVMDWALDGEFDRLWQFILNAYKRDLPDKVIGVLAAGPLEDLLAKRGVDFIDRIEELARRDPKFNHPVASCKNVLEMRFVASNKKVLEMICEKLRVYLPALLSCVIEFARRRGG